MDCHRHLAVIAWRALALLALTAGIIGVILPVVPTTPFLLLAAWSAARGWPDLERRILDHKEHGPSLRAWREQGSIPRRAKWLASLTMSLSIMVIWLSGLPAAAASALTLLLLGVAVWLWSRPE
jgi:uncharacterized membrane protein YbaN (DUF454 family)